MVVLTKMERRGRIKIFFKDRKIKFIDGMMYSVQ